MSSVIGRERAIGATDGDAGRPAGVGDLASTVCSEAGENECPVISACAWIVGVDQRIRAGPAAVGTPFHPLGPAPKSRRGATHASVGRAFSLNLCEKSVAIVYEPVCSIFAGRNPLSVRCTHLEQDDRDRPFKNACSGTVLTVAWLLKRDYFLDTSFAFCGGGWHPGIPTNPPANACLPAQADGDR
jgi:hypothetical protein